MSDSTSTFLYHSSGAPVGGVITQPTYRSIDAIGGAALPIVGGKASNEVRNGSFEDLFTFTRAYTNIEGKPQSDGSVKTELEVGIEGLSIMGRLTADRIVTKLKSTYAKDADEGCIVADGSTIENMKFDGQSVAHEFDYSLFNECDTFYKFKKKFKDDHDFRTKSSKQFLWDDVPSAAPNFLKDRYKWHTDKQTPPESKGIIPCTLVKSLSHSSGSSGNSSQAFGNVLVIPDFGTIFFGEVNMQYATRQMTMMRVEIGMSALQGAKPRSLGAASSLGTAMYASLSIGGGNQNGATYP